MSGTSLGVTMHGVTVNVACEHPRLLDYVACLLPGQTGPPQPQAQFLVHCHWLTRPAEEQPGPLADGGGLDGFGKRMLLGRDRLDWPDTHRNRDLQLRFARSGEQFRFDVVYRYLPSAKKLAKYADYEAKKCFDLLRYLVLFPVTWHLERTLGWLVLHASAVAAGSRAVLVAGPGGAGKSTTCVALMARAGMRLVAENLLYFNGQRVFPLCEPIRLTEASLALLGPAAEQLVPLDLPVNLKDKSMYRLPEQGGEPAVPAAVFLPQFSRPGFVRPLPAELAAEQLAATNVLTLELNDYYWYRAALDLLWPQPGQAARLVARLEQLTRDVPVFTLGIDRAAGIEPVVRAVCTTLANPARGGVA